MHRYPIHFHLAQNCTSCFVKDCAIERSFFRCVSVHQTHDMLVTRNVAYDIIGHCYYLEEVRTTVAGQLYEPKLGLDLQLTLV